MKEVLSVAEREALKRELKDIERESTHKETGSNRSDGINRDVMKRQASRLDKAIHDRTPNLSPEEKNKVYKRAQELEDKIRVGMPTRNEMEQPERHPGAIRKQYEWNKRNSKDIKEWKNCKRSLDKDDPTTSNIEKFRR